MMDEEKFLAFATHSFTLPDMCLRIRDVLDDPHSDANDIARLIALDSSLTAKMLKLANSALFRFPGQIDEVSKAVSVIGGEAIYNLIVAETAQGAYLHFKNPLINLYQHRYASVYCAMVAKYIAKSAGIRGSERFFAMGMLQNLSELIVAQFTPDTYRMYMEEAGPAALPWERQRAVFGFDFAYLSGAVMEKWRLPISLFYPVSHLHDEQKVSHEPDAALLAYALRVTIRQEDKQNYGDIELFPPAEANMCVSESPLTGNAVDYANTETGKMISLIF